MEDAKLYGKLLLKAWSLRIYFPFGMVYVQELCECSICQMGEKQPISSDSSNFGTGMETS